MKKTLEFSLGGRAFVALNNLLKITGLCVSGGIAKAVISDGRVKVDGRMEMRKRCKIFAGQVVEFEGQLIAVVK